jgi:DNA-binding CsgD family transcriptional regulator
MKKTILVYGLVGGLLIAGLKLIEYRYMVVDHAVEIYGGLVALIFSITGIWLGVTLTKPKPEVQERLVFREVPGPVRIETAPASAEPFAVNTARQGELGITARELEILQAIADGLSNREIAERLYVSENTVKTHSSRLFDKLQARRRTQAVQRAKQAGLVP